MEAHAVLELRSRRRIYEFVRDRPGTHLRGIARALGTPLGTTLFHLDCLSKAGVVVVRMDGRYKRFFTNDALGRREKDYVAVLHRAIPRRLLAVLVGRGPRTQRELASDLAVSRSTVSFHLSNLVRQGVLACEARRPENLYSPAERELAERVLRGQRHAFADPVLDAILADGPAGPAEAAA